MENSSLRRRSYVDNESDISQQSPMSFVVVKTGERGKARPNK